MKPSVTRVGFIAVWVALLIAAALPSSLPRTFAAPVAAITGTATEQPTFTPTNTPGVPPRPTITPTRNPETGFADPAVTKAVNVAEARVGDEIVFTLSVTNRGNLAANDVVVTDPFPEYLDVIEATTTKGNVSSVGRTVIVDIGRLEAGEEVTIRIRVRVNELAQPPEGRNTVILVTSSPTDDPSNNSSQVTFRVVTDATPTPAVPQPTPTAAPPPVSLPRTGGEGSVALLPFAALAGLAALAASLLLHRRARR